LEILKANYLNTTTQAILTSSTDRAAYLFDRDVRFQYVSSGFNNDLTTSTIRVNFDETMTVSRLSLLEHNLKEYIFYYNGVTANTFVISGGDTTASSFISNSETSQYFRSTAILCTSVSIDMKKTITANKEKALGYLVISDTHIVLSRPPASKKYAIQLDPTEVVHTLSDGGTRIQNVADKYKVKLGYEYLATSVRDSLKTVWQLHTEMIFCPFGTTTSWDKVIFPCVWPGNFEFYRFSDDAAGAGFSGNIILKETPR